MIRKSFNFLDLKTELLEITVLQQGKGSQAAVRKHFYPNTACVDKMSKEISKKLAHLETSSNLL